MITRGFGANTLVTRGLGGGSFIPAENIIYSAGGASFGPTMGVSRSYAEQIRQEDRILMKILKAFLDEVNRG